jgi:hypothetical protein
MPAYFEHTKHFHAEYYLLNTLALKVMVHDVGSLIPIVNSPGRHKVCQGAPFLLVFHRISSLPPLQHSQSMDPNLALSLLQDTSTPPPPTNQSNPSYTRNPPPNQTAPPIEQLAVPERCTPNGDPMPEPIAQPNNNPPWTPPPNWYTGGPVFRIEDYICPRCAPLGVVCCCEPPGSGRPRKPIGVVQLCCTIL